MKNIHLLAVLSLVALTAADASGQLVINEVDADTASTDMLEFVEIYDGGIGNFPLNGLILVLFNGSAAGDASYLTVDLNGQLTDAQGYFVIGNAAVSPAPNIVIPNNTIQNGTDAIALLSDSPVNWPNGTPVANVSGITIVDAVVYETNDFADMALVTALTPGQPQVNEGGGANGSATDAIGRCPNGAGGALVTTSYITLSPTPGAANACMGATYPGSGEDLVLQAGFNGSTPTGGTGNDVRTAMAGDVLELVLDSPLTTFTGSPFLIALDAFPTGGPVPVPLVIGQVHVSAVFLVLVDGFTQPIPGLLPQLPPFGTSDTFLVPSGLTGTSLLLQGAALNPIAQNGVFSVTDGIEIMLL